MNTYWISLPCDLLSSLASFQCSLLHHLHLSSDLGLSKYVNQHSHLNLSRNVRLSVLYDLDFNTLTSHTSTLQLTTTTSRFIARNTPKSASGYSATLQPTSSSSICWPRHTCRHRQIYGIPRPPGRSHHSRCMAPLCRQRIWTTCPRPS